MCDIRIAYLKCKALTTSNGLILHASDPLEGGRHDWILSMRSGLDEEPSTIIFVDGKEYVIYGDSGCNIRDFMEVPLQGANFNAAQNAFNKAM